MPEVLAATWPWWTGALLACAWAAIAEAPRDSPKACLSLLVLVVSVAWTAAVVAWLAAR